MNNTVVGVIAHVDAGKTTLSEGILYTAGALRTYGRVDHRDTLMDHDALEKERGITIFASEAPFSVNGRPFTLMDTPGHVDFSSETERVLSILDYCILVISGTDGVQAHTRTLWRLLNLYEIPTFIFVTKMDFARRDKNELLSDIQSALSDAAVDFEDPERDDRIAMCDEEAMQMYLETGAIEEDKIRKLVASRLLFPVFFGSGLKLQGIEALLDALYRYAAVKSYGERFSARVFKISHDPDGTRLTHLKITGGTLHTKDVLVQGEVSEKVNQTRIINGPKYELTDEAHGGDVVAVTGITELAAGTELGEDGFTYAPVLTPVMRYALKLPEGADPKTVMPKVRELEDEDPCLFVSWNAYASEIEVGLMGEVQAEILKSLMKERYGLDVGIEKGHVLYKETVGRAVYGVGHYEPLRHYAEVLLVLEPLPRGSGLEFRSACSTDILSRNWQNLILQHLREKEHIGVLTGSPITDLRITLIAGRDHIKHTEGGDFRQATYRAVRQGLMQADSVLLEPYYRFRLELPGTLLSRAMNDIRGKSGTFLPPVYDGDNIILVGRAPVSELSDYAQTVAAYSSGEGRLTLDPDGYDLCHDADAVIAETGYIPEADLDNSPDSVFCSHGAGFLVPWQEVPSYMHLSDFIVKKNESFEVPKEALRQARKNYTDAELEELMLREFGPIKRAAYSERKTISADSGSGKEKKKSRTPTKRILIIDGYNVIFAWPELRALSEADIQAAREKLIQTVINYSAYRRLETVLVFDGYRVPGNRGEDYTRDNIRIVFTKERESGDLFIVKLLSELSDDYYKEVVTSDGIIQLSALRKGVSRISSHEFGELVAAASSEISDKLYKESIKGRAVLGETLDREMLENMISHQ